MRGLGLAGGLRATVRLARRDAWRNKGRSALVALMVALPVLVLSVVSVLARPSELDPQDDVALALGERAQAVVSLVKPGEPTVQVLQGSAYSPAAEPDGGDQGADEPHSSLKEPTPQQVRVQMQSLLPPGDRLLLDEQAVRGTFQPFDTPPPLTPRESARLGPLEPH